jgi:hypothetical protein
MVRADRAKHRKGSGAHHKQKATGNRTRWWRSVDIRVWRIVTRSATAST